MQTPTNHGHLPPGTCLPPAGIQTMLLVIAAVALAACGGPEDRLPAESAAPPADASSRVAPAGPRPASRPAELETTDTVAIPAEGDSAAEGLTLRNAWAGHLVLMNTRRNQRQDCTLTRSDSGISLTAMVRGGPQVLSDSLQFTEAITLRITANAPLREAGVTVRCPNPARTLTIPLLFRNHQQPSGTAAARDTSSAGSSKRAREPRPGWLLPVVALVVGCFMGAVARPRIARVLRWMGQSVAGTGQTQKRARPSEQDGSLDPAGLSSNSVPSSRPATGSLSTTASSEPETAKPRGEGEREATGPDSPASSVPGLVDSVQPLFAGVNTKLDALLGFHEREQASAKPAAEMQGLVERLESAVKSLESKAHAADPKSTTPDAPIAATAPTIPADATISGAPDDVARRLAVLEDPGVRSRLGSACNQLQLRLKSLDSSVEMAVSRLGAPPPGIGTYRRDSNALRGWLSLLVRSGEKGVLCLVSYLYPNHENEAAVLRRISLDLQVTLALLDGDMSLLERRLDELLDRAKSVYRAVNRERAAGDPEPEWLAQLKKAYPLTPFEPRGTDLDLTEHDPGDDEPGGGIGQVLAPGFRYGDKVLLRVLVTRTGTAPAAHVAFGER